MPKQQLRYLIKLHGQHQFLRDPGFIDHPVWSNALKDAGFWRPDTIADVVRSLGDTPIEILLCSIVKEKTWVKQCDPERYRYARKDGSLYQPANVYIEQEGEVVIQIIHNV